MQDGEFETFSVGQSVPTLVQCCQRAMALHIDVIDNVGALPFALIKPVLESCNAPTLQRLELASPHLETDTNDLWERICRSKFPLMVERWERGEFQEGSWKERYLEWVDDEARRLEEVAFRVRSRRDAAEQQKKSEAIKMTDRLPSKRPRYGYSAPPKTAIQKAREQASRQAKTRFQRPPTKATRMVPDNINAKVPLMPPPVPVKAGTTESTGAVTVTRRPLSKPLPPMEKTPLKMPSPAKAYSPTVSRSVPTTVPPRRVVAPSAMIATRACLPPLSSPTQPSDRGDSPSKKLAGSPSSPANGTRPMKPLPARSKQDKGSNLFMPRHMAYSQLQHAPARGPSR